MTGFERIYIIRNVNTLFRVDLSFLFLFYDFINATAPPYFRVNIQMLPPAFSPSHSSPEFSFCSSFFLNLSTNSGTISRSFVIPS